MRTSIVFPGNTSPEIQTRLYDIYGMGELRQLLHKIPVNVLILKKVYIPIAVNAGPKPYDLTRDAGIGRFYNQTLRERSHALEF